jgi:hypothetical protein
MVEVGLYTRVTSEKWALSEDENVSKYNLQIER